MALECDGSTRSATSGGHVDRSPATSPTATHFPAAGRGASVRRVVAGAGAGRYKLRAVVADVAQLVAHHLAKVRVAGSSPVVRSSSPVARRRRYGIFCARITPPGHRPAARVRTAGRYPAAVAFELFADVGGHDGHSSRLVDDLFAVLVVLNLAAGVHLLLDVVLVLVLLVLGTLAAARTGTAHHAAHAAAHTGTGTG